MTTTVNGIDELREPGPDRRPERLARGDPRAHRQVRRGLRRPPVDPRRRGARQDRQPIWADDRARNLTFLMVDGFRDQLFRSTGFQMGVNYGWNKVRSPRCPAAAASGPASRPCRWMRWAADGTSWSRSDGGARGRREAGLRGGVGGAPAGLKPWRRPISKEWPLRPSRTASGSSAGRCRTALASTSSATRRARCSTSARPADPQAGGRPLLQARSPRRR